MYECHAVTLAVNCCLTNSNDLIVLLVHTASKSTCLNNLFTVIVDLTTCLYILELAEHKVTPPDLANVYGACLGVNNVFLSLHLTPHPPYLSVCALGVLTHSVAGCHILWQLCLINGPQINNQSMLVYPSTQKQKCWAKQFGFSRLPRAYQYWVVIGLRGSCGYRIQELRGFV